MAKKIKELYYNWLMPIKYEFGFLIHDLSYYETDLESVFEIEYNDYAERCLRFYINGLELPNNEGQIEITIP